MQGYSLKKFFASPVPVRYLPLILLALSLVGFLDATYLTIIHYKNLIPPCSLSGCEVVLTSKYATIGSIPLAVIGAVYYLVLVILSLLFLQTKRVFFITLAFILTTLSLFASIILVYLQAGVLHAFCQYCLLSEAINFLLFDTAWWMWNGQKKADT